MQSRRKLLLRKSSDDEVEVAPPPVFDINDVEVGLGAITRFLRDRVWLWVEGIPSYTSEQV